MSSKPDGTPDQKPWSERLSAYRDGELSPSEAAEVEERLRADPLLRDRMDAFDAVDASLRRLGDDMLRDADVQSSASTVDRVDRIDAAARGRPTRAVRSGGPSLRRRSPRATLALAASIAAPLAIAGWLLTGGDGAPQRLIVGPVPSDGVLARVLESEPTGGARRDGETVVVPLATFIDAAGRACREVERAETTAIDVAIACRAADGGWTIEASQRVDLAEELDPNLAPAAGAEDDALASALDRLGAGPALSPSEEAALLARSWRGE